MDCNKYVCENILITPQIKNTIGDECENFKGK